MQTSWRGRNTKIELSAVGLPERPEMPAYVRVVAESYPMDITVLLTPADARKFAAELYGAVDAAEREEPELISFAIPGRVVA